MRVLRTLGAALAALLAVAADLRPADPSGAGRPMTPRDIIELKQVSDPQVSPDGSRVAFVVTALDSNENLYQSDVWIGGRRGG